jgi:hypothetical protein
MSNLTTKQAEELEKDAVKKEKKAEAKAEKEKKILAVSCLVLHCCHISLEPYFSCLYLQSSKIVLTKMSRTKKKATTSIYGLHLFSPPLPALKVVAKG